MNIADKILAYWFIISHIMSIYYILESNKTQWDQFTDSQQHIAH